MKKLLIWGVCVFGFIQAQAQNLTFYGILPAYSQTGRLGKKMDYNIFTSTTIDAFSSYQNNKEYPAKDLQFYFQPSLIYKFNPDFNVAVSYTYQRNNPLSTNSVNEHRIWQQCILAHSFGKLRITNRFRLEERFIENLSTMEYPISTRFRYQLGFNMPLQGKTLDVYEFYFNSYNECYFSLTGNKNATYSENWTYAGLGYKMSNSSRFEIGYLLQIGVYDKQKDLRFMNLAQVSWITNFNPKKKK